MATPQQTSGCPDISETDLYNRLDNVVIALSRSQSVVHIPEHYRTDVDANRVERPVCDRTPRHSDKGWRLKDAEIYFPEQIDLCAHCINHVERGNVDL